jgi:hypothetical protein
MKLLLFRRIYGELLSLLLPGLGRCYRCGIPWYFPHWWFGRFGTESHNTNFSPGRGCFPLCEWCWSRLTPKDRLPYYRMLMNLWVVQHRTQELGALPFPQDDWPAIQAAVLEGK